MTISNDGNIVKRSSQYIDNLGFDETTGLPMVELAGSDGTGVLPVGVTSDGKLKTDATISGTVTSSPTFKDDPTAAGETPKYGKTNSSTHKQMVEADTGLVQPTTPSDTQPVSAASLPLPAGATTSVKQDTAQTSLNTLVTDIDYRFSGGKTAYSTTIAASGNTNLIVPAAGHHLEVYWISFVPNSDNTAANLVKLGFGTAGGAISTELYRSYAMAHWEYFVGATNQAFIINTVTAEPVAVTVHYKEI